MHTKIKFVSQLSFHLKVVANIWKETDITFFLTFYTILYKGRDVFTSCEWTLKSELIKVISSKLNIFPHKDSSSKTLIFVISTRTNFLQSRMNFNSCLSLSIMWVYLLKLRQGVMRLTERWSYFNCKKNPLIIFMAVQIILLPL